ncbi:hypothetical protein MHK_004727 [Candidatus Magnetomorum sp. HK-1]|nr:hypothetical protein MHK_004727 [Candidatus Magnetomorum sp. HK-1]
MMDSQKIIYAIQSMLPDSDALKEFQQDCLKNEEIIDSLLSLAKKNEIIKTKNLDALDEFIKTNRLDFIKDTETKQLPDSFADLIDQTEYFLGVKNASLLINEIDALVDQFNIQLKIIHRSKFSVIKKSPETTPGKRNTLRALAFWIGYNRSHLVEAYNYNKLLLLCQNQKESRKEIEVCRVLLSLFSRGDEPSVKMMDDLKSQVYSFINKKIDAQAMKVVKSDAVSSCNVHFYKLKASISPASYSQYINNAIQLAYQIAIQWFLSPHGSKQVFLSIGIAAGEEKYFNPHLKAIVEKKLPDDPVIRLTEYTRQCILMNEIRVITSDQPVTVEISNGEIINIWWISGLWNTIYWDFVPDLLDNSLLQSHKKLINLLWSPEIEETETETETESETESESESDKKEQNTIQLIFKHPHNTLLGLEIAKTLYYRQKFFEANEIIRIILSRDPKNLIARSLRMDIYCNQGIISNTYSKSYMYFRRAEEESSYIDEYCSIKDEDYYCECGLVKLAHALTIFRLLRHNNGVYENLDEKLSKINVFTLLKESEFYFEKGLTCSPSGTRSIYLLLCTRSFRRLISKNGIYFENPDVMLTDPYDIFKETGKELFHLAGWIRDDLSPDQKFSFFHQMADKAIQLHRHSNFLRSFIPNTLFCYAVFIWDFCPAITPEIAIKIIKWLYESRKASEELWAQDLSIFSITRFNGEIMKADIFTQHINKIINQIETMLDESEILKSKKNYQKWITNSQLFELKLCLVNI